jgi:hypothetical protein
LIIFHQRAADFGLYIEQKSIDDEEEYFSFIFMGIDENGNEYFYYDEPRNDYETHEERSMSFYISWDGMYGEPVAITHTYGSYDANTGNTKDEFSSPGNVAPEKNTHFLKLLLEQSL